MVMTLPYPRRLSFKTSCWYASYLLGRFYESDVSVEHKYQFKNLKPGDLVLDIGANVGYYSFALALRGSVVHAFEPNPVAYSELSNNIGTWPNVVLHNAAAHINDGLTKLYLHKHSDSDPLTYSTGSSIMQEKENVIEEGAISVKTIDLAHFILSLDQPVKLMKMDIEGAETIVLPHLVKTGALEKVETILVELHDEKNDALRDSTKQMKSLLETCSQTRIFFDWH